MHVPAVADVFPMFQLLEDIVGHTRGKDLTIATFVEDLLPRLARCTTITKLARGPDLVLQIVK